jgi:Ca-activated chloride channel family protein
VSPALPGLAAISLREPSWLALVPIVLLAAVWRARAGRGSVRLSEAALLDEGAAPPVSWRVRLRHAPVALEAIGVLLAVVGLARPAEAVSVPVRTQGADLLLCLDVSSSMADRDLDPTRTRLEVALDAARRFVAARPDDRIGLVTFARFPDLRCPPTLDHDALRAILADVAPVAADAAEDATGIGTAVARAAQVLAGSEGTSRVVVLLTDGEENVATTDRPQEIAPAHAAQLCQRLKVRVHSVLAAPTRTAQAAAALRDLATRTGGAYAPAKDAEAVAASYARIDALEKTPFAEPATRLEDRFLPFLAAAIALVLVGRALAAGPLRVLP